MFPVALKAGTLPVRGVLEFVRFTSPLALYCLAATATLFCVLSFCFFSLKSRVVRVLFFIPYLLLLIVSNTLESISYSTYANLVFLFAMCLIPRIPSKTKRAEHWQWGLEWKIGQVIFLVYYGLTGFWKLYFLILNFDFFDLNILNRMIAGYLIKWGKDMALGSWLLDWPVISCLGFYAILALQLGSFWVLMQNQKIVRLWGFLYLLFIVSSYFAMDIIFTGLLPGIFFFLILPGWETQFSSRRQIARIFGVR
ncbi:MAG: hypothetical protein ACK5Y2_14010 [Bdellovibrionales bacterium]